MDKILSFFLCRSSSNLVSHWFLIFLKLVFLLLFPNTMSQVPGSHERVGLPSELPATERAHFGDKFKQRSGHKVQVNARTFQNSIVKKKKKIVTEMHVKTADLIDGSCVRSVLWLFFCWVAFLFFVLLLSFGFLLNTSYCSLPHFSNQHIS